MSTVIRLLLVCVTVLGLGACRDRAAPASRAKARMVVLGIDGMDPGLTRRLMAEGRMPNFSRLASAGTFSTLGTSSPPESPVAWSDFITSQHSDAHGIYDFVHRDPSTMSPYLSTSRAVGGASTLRLGSWALPLGGGHVELLRKGRPFWNDLDAAGVAATLLMLPATYPPPPEGNARVLAGMGTPDLFGTYGVFQLFSSDPEWRDVTVPSGIIHMVDLRSGYPAKLELRGPPSPFSATGAAMTAPLSLVVDEHAGAALLRLGEEERLLAAGEWSDWVPFSFEPAPLVGSIPAMVRFYLKSTKPLLLYASPLNFDPKTPAQPFATPGVAEHLAGRVGRFHTVGIPEDVKALESGVLDDDEYLRLVEDIFQERVRVLDSALDELESGFLFVYFGTIDQLSHAFWRTLEPRASLENRRRADVIPSYYARIDEVVGKTLQRLGQDVPLFVMSDHGFTSFRTKVNLNTWLRREGYLVLKDGANDADVQRNIDWEKTRAYGLGLNLMYVNVRGREREGIVPAEEREPLVREIASRLERLTDPETGKPAVTKVFLPPPGAFPDRTPDAVIGYAPGYRASEDSALGRVTKNVLDDNLDKWSGDHCVDSEAVPGLLASTLHLKLEPRPHLVDLGPTFLDYFGVSPPAHIAGKSLLIRQVHP